MGTSRPPRTQWALTILVGLALVAVAAGVFAGMYALARRGTFDALLRRRTPPPITSATPRPPSPTFTTRPSVQPSATPAPTRTPARQTPPPATPATATMTSVIAAVSPTPTPTATATDQPTAAVGAARYQVTYLGCDPRGSDIGIVKGQILDSRGAVVPGAEVRITLDDWVYDQPAVSNEEGWYEFYLQKGLKIRIASLRIRGVEMQLLGQDQVFLSQGGCFEHVNLVQQ